MHAYTRHLTRHALRAPLPPARQALDHNAVRLLVRHVVTVFAQRCPPAAYPGWLVPMLRPLLPHVAQVILSVLFLLVEFLGSMPLPSGSHNINGLIIRRHALSLNGSMASVHDMTWRLPITLMDLENVCVPITLMDLEAHGWAHAVRLLAAAHTHL